MSHPAGDLGAIHDAGSGPLEGCTDEDAADGILVVQVRRLRAISREVSELAARGTNRQRDPEEWKPVFPSGQTRGACPQIMLKQKAPESDLTQLHRTLGLADQLPAIGRSVADGVAPLPCQIGQASGQGLMAVQAARSQNVADIGRKPRHLGFHQGGASSKAVTLATEASSPRSQVFLHHKAPAVQSRSEDCRAPAASIAAGT
jgi:hypothetical protein